MLEVRNLAVEYKKGKPVVNAVNLTLHKKEKVMLLGPNGSGKTTLMRAILGLVKYNGDIKIDGKSLERLRCELCVATNLDEVYYLLALNVKELTSLYMDLKGCDVKYCIELMEDFGLKDTFGKKLWQLSSGQKRLITNVLALASRPKMLLMDEVFEGVDPARKLTLANLFNQFGGSMLITTHELSMLKYFHHWGLYFMFEGKLFGKVNPSSKILDAGIVRGEDPNAILKVEAAGKVVSIVPKAGRPLREFVDLNMLYEELIIQ
ncbi:MAG: ATP-binding cassette domain-containing protein [Candidatus Bathyarchaeota archaeon]|nr:ATP-binding cassette domain-containing protein [Candidatus Bathyarchaeota archaeon]